MASDTFSSALSYALERLGTPNLTLKEEQRKTIEAVYQGNSVFVWLPTGFGKSICFQAFPFMIEYKKGQCGSTLLLLLAMTTCFMSNQTCRVGGGFCLILYVLHSLPEVITHHYSSILRRFVVTEHRAFGIGAHSLFG